MSRNPVITGIGLVTPLGVGVDPTWNALLAGHFIKTHARCPSHDVAHDRVHHLAQAAAGEAIRDAKWDSAQSDDAKSDGAKTRKPGGAAIVVGTSKGAVETWLEGREKTVVTAPPNFSDFNRLGQSTVDDHFGLASVASAVRASWPLLDGPSITLSAACASGLHALIRAAMMIQSGEADRVLVVAAEASVHPLFLGSFRRLGVLPREGVGCRPFDQRRDGFLMSEAAAAICLEASHPASLDAAKPYARIDRFAMGGDAIHMTAGDPDGQSLRHLIRSVLNGRHVDLIHAHGTGTPVNDPIELAAFESECAGHDRPVSLYSHKGALGHSLGAAGLVSIVLNCVMHRRGVVPPNVQTCEPLPTKRVCICREAATKPVDRSIAAAAGFGGPMAVVSLVSP